MLKRIFSLTLVSFLLGACDSIHGITHINNKVLFYPKSKCIKNAVTSIDGVSQLEYKEYEGSVPLTLHGLEEKDKIHSYFYKYHDIRGYFSFSVNYKGEVKYFQSYTDINRVPPQKNIDKIRPIMFKIEKNIEKECNLVNYADR